MATNIIQVGGIGCVLFTALLMIAGVSGMAAEIRDEEGQFKKPLSSTAIIGMLLMTLLILGIQVWGNIRGIQTSTGIPDMLSFWVNGFAIFMVIHLYDLIVLDYLIIVLWHPTFLNLPDTDYYTKLRPHFIGFIKGIPFGILLSLVAALLTLLIKSI